jgi:15-cis-phytoene synthase
LNDSIQLCRASISQHSKSFALASRLLPGAWRDEAAVVYAWCRRADDAIDLVPQEAQPRALAQLRRELDSIYGGEAQADLVLSAFQTVVVRRAVPRAYADELLAGMEMDATGASYPDEAALLVYCYRVASTVGLMMSHVFGVREPGALRHAAHLGMAMQLTNVCRDVHEDWQRGRLYLPDSLLGEAGAPHLRSRLGGPLPRDAREPVARVTRELLCHAATLYESGDRGIPLLPFRAAVAVRAARHVYADIGRVVLAQGADPFAPRAVVSTPRKLALAAAAALRTLFDVPRQFAPAPLVGHVRFQDVVPTL